MKRTTGSLICIFLLSRSCISSLVQFSNLKAMSTIHHLSDTSGLLASMRPEVQERTTPLTPRVSTSGSTIVANSPGPRIVKIGTVPPPALPTLLPSSSLPLLLSSSLSTSHPLPPASKPNQAPHSSPRISPSKDKPSFFSDSPYDFTITTPTDSTQWIAGTQAVIRWKALRASESRHSNKKARLQLLLKEKVVSNLTDSIDAHSSQFIWLVPYNLKTNKNYYLRIGANSYSRIFEIRGLPPDESESSQPDTVRGLTTNTKSFVDSGPSRSSPSSEENYQLSSSEKHSPGGMISAISSLLSLFIVILPELTNIS